MNSYLKLYFTSNIILALTLYFTPTSFGETIYASQIRAFINNSQTTVQKILDDIAPPDTRLKEITSSSAELNALDGISANVTANNLNTLTGGANSDADALHTHPGGVGNAGTLDNLDSAQFLRSDANDTFEGDTLTLNGDMSLASGGNILTSSNGNVTINPNGSGIIQLGTSTNETGIQMTGDLTVSGNISNPAISSLKLQVESLNTTLMDLQSKNSFEPALKEFREHLPQVIQELASLKEHVTIEKSNAVTMNSSLLVKGALEVEGPITSILQSENFGKMNIFSQYSLKPFLFERGESKLLNGEMLIYLSAQFLEAVVIDEDHSLFVKTTLLSADCHPLAVVERTSHYFRVKELYDGQSNCPFLWEASAHRKSHEKNHKLLKRRQ